MNENTSKVYVKTDDRSCIIQCDGGYSTPSDLEDWVKIDEGTGDKYNLCQSHYFDGGLYTNTSPAVPRYKLVDGVPVLRSEEEIAADRLPDLDALRAAKQEVNKQALADWLAAHPLTWTDGKVYGVTEQDQTEMAINLAQYQLAVAAEQPAVLEWHAQKQQCHTFTIDEYTALSLAIAAYVYPYRRYQEEVKAAIYSAETKEQIDEIVIDYSLVQNQEE